MPHPVESTEIFNFKLALSRNFANATPDIITKTGHKATHLSLRGLPGIFAMYID